MSYNFFAYLSRMRYIGRWSLMRNALPENIQEHSHMVAVIAHALAIIRRDVLGVPCNPEEYAAVLQEMEALGFDSGFIQPLDSADCYNPDFSREEPFGEG